MHSCKSDFASPYYCCWWWLGVGQWAAAKKGCDRSRAGSGLPGRCRLALDVDCSQIIAIKATAESSRAWVAGLGVRRRSCLLQFVRRFTLGKAPRSSKCKLPLAGSSCESYSPYLANKCSDYPPKDEQPIRCLPSAPHSCFIPMQTALASLPQAAKSTHPLSNTTTAIHPPTSITNRARWWSTRSRCKSECPQKGRTGG